MLPSSARGGVQVLHHPLHDSPTFDGSTTAYQLHSRAAMNPKAEALKQRTFLFALAIIRFCRTLRDSWEGRELSDQLFRSGVRIGANYRAACRARSHADFVNKMGVVVEEADETVYWLEVIQASEVCEAPALPALLTEAGQLCAIFTQSHITARANAATARRPKPPDTSGIRK